MIVDKRDNITIVTQEKVSIPELIRKFEILYQRHKNNHVIINLSSLNIINATQLDEFLKLSKHHRSTNYSFVIVTNKVDLDAVSNQLIVVPTLQEAHDIIEMEDIERDLGL